MKMKAFCSWVAWAGLMGLAAASGCGNNDSKIGEQGGAANGESCGRVGATTLARDGCNTCTCSADGSIGCTKIGCACNPDHEWARSYVGSSPQACAVIDFACPANTSMFQNECGCGCEQSLACPEFFGCEPGSGCDTDALAALCPYTTFAL